MMLRRVAAPPDRPNRDAPKQFIVWSPHLALRADDTASPRPARSPPPPPAAWHYSRSTRRPGQSQARALRRDNRERHSLEDHAARSVSIFYSQPPGNLPETSAAGPCLRRTDGCLTRVRHALQVAKLTPAPTQQRHSAHHGRKQDPIVGFHYGNEPSLPELNQPPD